MALSSIGMDKFNGRFSLQANKVLELSVSLLNISMEDTREGNDDRIST